MLKIKDSVPLSELKKFGFEYRYGYYFVGEYFRTNITINKDRKIEFEDEWWGGDFALLNYLFDLIKADLVEKV